ncbi:hypothetical protein TraAM80_05290 [Trypanosoma rangeli]|uniref:Uncharacterized protein n=1 Tax=Trypanosoma rangeli TaxID=5698 RepID=A0A422NFE3_TRYRA|nr:uncharacterized protein TraAM80_05290 [Trypanosoma rangeli]RNF04185.1 hypothetical protein TraAM80_05290 [Trypanosoma rangeli]|eukprot:RNF04185.1 hypothetical protein TraAM80_05290 [Trypanosoma rangeli]
MRTAAARRTRRYGGCVHSLVPPFGWMETTHKTTLGALHGRRVHGILLGSLTLSSPVPRAAVTLLLRSGNSARSHGSGDVVAATCARHKRQDPLFVPLFR